MKKSILNKKDKQFVKEHFEKEKYLFSYCTDYMTLSRIEELYNEENICEESTTDLTTGIVCDIFVAENEFIWLKVLVDGKIHLAKACTTTEANILGVLSGMGENVEEWTFEDANNSEALNVFRMKPFLLKINFGVVTLVRPLDAALAEEAVRVMKRMISNGYLEFTDINGEEIA